MLHTLLITPLTRRVIADYAMHVTRVIGHTKSYVLNQTVTHDTHVTDHTKANVLDQTMSHVTHVIGHTI